MKEGTRNLLDKAERAVQAASALLDSVGAEFAAIKAANFHPGREDYFHYSVHMHNYNATSNSSGQAERSCWASNSASSARPTRRTSSA